MKISRRPPIISIFQKPLLKDLGGPCPVITQNRLAPLSPSLARTYISPRISPYAQAKWMQSLIATGYEDYPEGNPDRTQLSKGSLLRLDFSSRASFLFFLPFFYPYLVRWRAQWYRIHHIYGIEILSLSLSFSFYYSFCTFDEKVKCLLFFYDFN